MKKTLVLLTGLLNAWDLSGETVNIYLEEEGFLRIIPDEVDLTRDISFCITGENNLNTKIFQTESNAEAYFISAESISTEKYQNCSLFSFTAGDDLIIRFTVSSETDAGYFTFNIHEIIAENGLSEPRIFRIRALRAKWVYILDQSLGWLYFLLWSISFYPQVVMNFRRKSVVGFNFDYLGYDYAGFISFTLYNCLIFFSPAVFGLYQTVYPGAANPIQSNDVLFCIHAMLIQSVNLYQCFTYERAGQDLSKTCKSILVVVSIAVALSTIFAGTGAVESFGWFQVLSFMSYIKVGSSLIKYMPQVYLNWKRKCTLGFAIDMAILDVSGGSCCYLQTITQYINANDVTIISGNIGKIGIGFVSVFFDIILLIQHYCLYGKNNEAKIITMEKEVEEKSPFVSQQLGQILTASRVGFSPTTSAVIYHGAKGDLLASTASFRDIFNSHADIRPDQAWTNVMESVTGSRAFGHSTTNSRPNIVLNGGKL